MKGKIHKIISAVAMLALLMTAFASLSFGVSVRADANDAGYGGNYIGNYYGEIDTGGATGIYGYTSNYVLWGGAQEVQHEVKDGWHIVASSYYYSRGVGWYECWDSDDGDYYGWIDGSYLYFYSTSYESPEEEFIPPPRETTTIYEINPRRGEVYAPSGDVYGYTDNYVIYSHAQETQHKVQHTWHITAYTTCYAHGVTWYECWDTDDGDYYGWIDENFLRFYDEYPRTEPPTEATTTKATTTTTTTQATTVSEAVTTVETEMTTMSTSATEQVVPVAAIVSESDDDDMFSGTGMIMIIVIAIAIILLAIVAILLILLLFRKRKEDQSVGVVPSTQTNTTYVPQSEEPVKICPNCGAPRCNSDGNFCDQCGFMYEN